MVVTKQELEAKGLTHSNAVTGRMYLGFTNQSKLHAHNKESKKRVTFHQCKKNGRSLKPGSKGVVLAYVDYDHESGEPIKNAVVSFHRLYNLQDVDTSGVNANKITEKQRHLLTKLVRNRYSHNPVMVQGLLAKVDDLSSSKASELIKQLVVEKYETATE